jgi:choline kinase
MKAIIIAAGEATRWGDYLNTPKHLIEIDGEPLLHRTVRLLKQNGVKQIYVVSKDDPRYQVSGATQYIAKLDYKTNADADKFLSSKHLWNRNGRTIVLYGDVYFTDKSMQTICKFNDKEWTLFCRPNESRFTGTPWGECFAQSFYDEDISKHEEALHRIAKLHRQKKIDRCGGWEHYRAMIGVSDNKIRSKIFNGHYVIIDDLTDDFDYPEDFERWIKMREMYAKGQL